MALPSNHKRILAAQRRRKALFLRSQGYSMAEIANALDCSVATVSKTINTAVKNYHKDTNELVRKMVLQETEVLNELYRKVLPKVVKKRKNGQDEISFRAVEKVLQIHDRKARLHGLSRPEKVIIDGTIELGSPEQAKEALLEKLREKMDA